MTQAPPPPPPLPEPAPKSNNTSTIIIIVAVVGGVVLLACGGILAGILLPALSDARGMAHRSVCGANLNGVFMSMYSYSVSNGDQFPPHVGMLLNDGTVGPQSFVCPAHTPDASGISYAGQAPPAPYYAFGDYFWVYTGLGGANAPPDSIIAFSRSHDGEGRNVSFGDGSVRFLAPLEFEEALRDDRAYRKQMGIPPIDLSALGESGPKR